MKNIILLLFLITSSSLVVSQTTEESITEIRKMYKETENVLNTCQIITSIEWVDEGQYNGYTPELTAYYDPRRKEIVKIIEYGAGDWRESTTSYYLRDGLLFFVFKEEYYADEMYTSEEMGVGEQELHESGGEAKSILYSEQRIYLKDEVVIRNLIKEKVFLTGSGNTSLKDVDNVEEEMVPDAIDDILQHLSKMLSFLKTKI